MQPALLDLLPVHQITMPHSDAIDSLGITPRSFLRRLAYRFSGSSLCISELHSTSLRVGISV